MDSLPACPAAVQEHQQRPPLAAAGREHGGLRQGAVDEARAHVVAHDLDPVARRRTAARREHGHAHRQRCDDQLPHPRNPSHRVSPLASSTVRAAIGSDAAWELPAVPPTVAAMRHHVASFAAAAGAPETMAYAVELAVSELVTNVVLHAYVGREPGRVSVSCQGDGVRITIEVADEGVGVAPRDDSPGVGHGLALVGGLAAHARDRARRRRPRHGRHAVVRRRGAPAELSGLEPLCALALEHLADASCLDVVHGGVLRRVTAEVAGDMPLTAGCARRCRRPSPGRPRGARCARAGPSS